MENYTDEELVKELINGNEKAFDYLYRRYSRKVYSIIARITKDEDLAEDIMQEVFVKTYKNIKNFKFKSTFFTWLYRIAVNTALTGLKKKSKLKESELNQEILPSESSPDKKLEGEYIKQQIEAAVDTLPEKQRLIFSLRFYEDLKYSEIAEITKISLNACKTNYHYATNALKEKLGVLI